MSSKIYIKANENAPEFISQGNFHAERKEGYFETDNRKLADFIIGAGHGKEVKKKSSQTKPKPAETEPAQTADATQTEAGKNTTEGGAN